MAQRFLLLQYSLSTAKYVCWITCTGAFPSFGKRTETVWARQGSHRHGQTPTCMQNIGARAVFKTHSCPQCIRAHFPTEFRSKSEKNLFWALFCCDVRGERHLTQEILVPKRLPSTKIGLGPVLNRVELSAGQINPKLLWNKTTPFSWMFFFSQTAVPLRPQPFCLQGSHKQHNCYYFCYVKSCFSFPCCSNSKLANSILLKLSDNNAISEDVYRLYFQMTLKNL